MCPVAVAPEDPRSYYKRRRAAHRRAQRVPAQPVRQPEQPARPRQDHRARAVGADRRAHHPLRRRRRHVRVDHRHRPLPEGAEPGHQDHRRRPRGLGVLRRVGPAVPGRGRRRGLLPRRLATRPVRRGDRRSATRRASSRPAASAQIEGILIGGSGGMAVAAAIQVAKRARPDDIVVVFNPDSGRGYLSRVFDDDWMANFGFLTRVRPVRRRRARHPQHVARQPAVRQPATRPCARRSSGCGPTASASCRCARTRRRSPPPRCRARSTSSS